MSPARTGPIPQRELVTTLRALIDAAAAANSTAHRDIARSQLRQVLETTNWRTTFVLGNIGPRRCRYLASTGHWVGSKFLLTDWRKRPGEDKPDAPD